MSSSEARRKRQIFIASAELDIGEVRAGIQQLDLDAVTLEQVAAPGGTWSDSLRRCVAAADVVIGIMGDRRKEPYVFFELGVASALNKPTLLFLGPDYPMDLVPPSGLPYLRIDLRDADAVIFGLKQALALSGQDLSPQPAGGFTTRPIGPLADQLLERLPHTNPGEFEGLMYEAIKASGVSTMARGGGPDDEGIDFAVWSNDLEPMITNPLLIECKSSLRTQSAVDEALGRMLRALGSIRNGCGIVLYKEIEKVPKAVPRSPSVAFISAEDFITGLRDTGLAEFVLGLRGTSSSRC